MISGVLLSALRASAESPVKSSSSTPSALPAAASSWRGNCGGALGTTSGEVATRRGWPWRLRGLAFGDDAVLLQEKAEAEAARKAKRASASRVM